MYERRWKTLSQLQWINDSYLLVFAALLLSLGTFGDRFGRKLALVAGTAIFGLASLAALLVDTPEQLIGVRAVMGVGGALIMPATLSIISNVFPREERTRAIAVWAGPCPRAATGGSLRQPPQQVSLVTSGGSRFAARGQQNGRGTCPGSGIGLRSR